MLTSYTQLQGVQSPAGSPGVMFGEMRNPGAHRWSPAQQRGVLSPLRSTLCCPQTSSGLASWLLPKPCLSRSFPSKDRGASREGEEEKCHCTFHYWVYFTMLSLFVILNKQKLKKLKSHSSLKMGYIYIYIMQGSFQLCQKPSNSDLKLSKPDVKDNLLNQWKFTLNQHQNVGVDCFNQPKKTSCF